MTTGEALPPGWLPREEYDAIYRRVPRTCVEVVIADARGVLLALRDHDPLSGLWHLPGGTVLFGESLHGALRRVARMELGIAIEVGELLGVIEYPSHYEPGHDCPVGIAFRCTPSEPLPDVLSLRSECRWCPAPPDPMHPDQVGWLAARGLWHA